eukprot:3045-Heterococcus_DN1.PRE.2
MNIASCTGSSVVASLRSGTTALARLHTLHICYFKQQHYACDILLRGLTSTHATTYILHRYVLMILGVSCLYEVALTVLDYQMKTMGVARFRAAALAAEISSA